MKCAQCLHVSRTLRAHGMGVESLHNVFSAIARSKLTVYIMHLLFEKVFFMLEINKVNNLILKCKKPYVF